MSKSPGPKLRKVASNAVPGECLCGEVRIEIDFPARWAWHDHSAASRHVHGAAYATYVGSWRSRFRITGGEPCISRFEDPAAGTIRSFCSRCGTPISYERSRSPQMVNVPLAPLKGFPGVLWDRSRRKTSAKSGIQEFM